MILLLVLAWLLCYYNPLFFQNLSNQLFSTHFDKPPLFFMTIGLLAFALFVYGLRETGDTIQHIGAHPVVITRPIIQSAVNTVETRHSHTDAQALKEIVALIEKSGSTGAATCMQAFLEQLSQPKPQPSKLKAFGKTLRRSCLQSPSCRRRSQSYRALSGRRSMRPAAYAKPGNSI